MLRYCFDVEKSEMKAMSSRNCSSCAKRATTTEKTYGDDELVCCEMLVNKVV